MNEKELSKLGYTFSHKEDNVIVSYTHTFNTYDGWDSHTEEVGKFTDITKAVEYISALEKEITLTDKFLTFESIAANKFLHSDEQEVSAYLFITKLLATERRYITSL